MIQDAPEAERVENVSRVKQAAKPAATKLSADDVVAYLQENNDFFLDHPDLLATLSLPLSNGRTISLAQRQTSLLRERNTALRGRLQALLANAQSNDLLFEKTRTLGLSLMRVESELELNQALANQLKEAFGADHLSCFLASEFEGNMGMLVWCKRYPLAELFDPNQARCVTLRASELNSLFLNRNNQSNGSALLVPLTNSKGMLAIGSDNSEQFNNEEGTLFIDFIGELIDVTIQRVVELRDQPGT